MFTTRLYGPISTIYDFWLMCYFSYLFCFVSVLNRESLPLSYRVSTDSLCVCLCLVVRPLFHLSEAEGALPDFSLIPVCFMPHWTDPQLPRPAWEASSHAGNSLALFSPFPRGWVRFSLSCPQDRLKYVRSSASGATSWECETFPSTLILEVMGTGFGSTAQWGQIQ